MTTTVLVNIPSAFIARAAKFTDLQAMKDHLNGKSTSHHISTREKIPYGQPYINIEQKMRQIQPKIYLTTLNFSYDFLARKRTYISYQKHGWMHHKMLGE